MKKETTQNNEGITFRKYLIPSMLGMLAVSAHSFVVGYGVGAAAVTAKPFMKVLDDYNISDNRKMHWQRVLHWIYLRRTVGIFFTLSCICE